MSLFSTKSKKHRSDEDSRHAVQTIGHAFATEFKKNKKNKEKDDDAGKTNCCISLFNHAKKIKIPESYQEIINWLTALALHSTITNEIIGSALGLSLKFASSQVIGDTATEMAAAALQVVITGITSQFNLNIDVTPDYTELAQYCRDNNITIPAGLQELLQETEVEIEVALPAAHPA